MTRFRLRLEYDGTEFHGWAESDGVRTVAGSLRQSVERITRTSEIEIRGASRTDAGVHALDQCAVVTVETRLDTPEFGRALEAVVPDDLGVVSCEVAPEGFDPIRDAVEKQYVYRIRNARRAPVHGRRGQWWVGSPLDEAAMGAAGSALVGRHDFAAFRNRSKGEPEDSVRTVRHVSVHREGEELWVVTIGDGFLYRMVRNIVGTLVEVGRGAWVPGLVAEVLRSRDRRRAGPLAPPHGLYLVQVVYPGDPPARPIASPLRF